MSSSRSSFRGARNQWHRGFSDRPGYPHLGFRPPPPPPPHGQAFNAVPPPPFYANQTFRPPPQQHNGAMRPQTPFRNQNRPPPQRHGPMRPQTPFYNQNRPPPQQHNGPTRPQTPFHNQNRLPPQQHNGPTRPQTPFYNQNRPPPQQHNGQMQPQMPFHNQSFRPRPQRPMDFRGWELPKSGTPPSHNHTLQFKVLSYNLLAEYLAINHRAKLYFHIPRYMLDWDWRKKSIIFELGLWSADILCFQEVDRFQDLEEDLKLKGYSGIWKMRSGDPIDGCAIFWRASRFRLLHQECIEYNKLGLRDNVAQICVFELVNQNNDKDLSDSPARLPSSNRVVICNIHVLYNPRRGEIKLGQVRVLLDRAHAVCKHWDNAPVVLCGDFNCTPKSPLYNYISEQKLDLSDLPRDKVSGQASAEIRPQWQFNPNFRAPQNADCREGAMASSGQIHQSGSVNEHKEINPSVSAIVPSVNSSPQVPSEPKMCDIASKVEDCSNEIVVSSHEIRSGEALNELDGFENEPESTSSLSRTGLEKHLSSRDRENLVVEDLKNGNEPCAVDSFFEDSSKGENSKGENPLVVMKDSENLTSVLISSNDDIPKTSLEVNESNESDPDIILHEKTENLSLDGLDEHHEGDMGSGVDSSAFLPELHTGNVSVSNVVDDEPVNEVFYPYDPSGWTPMETESATGSSDCTVMEHSLKLKSSYTEAEDLSGTRDSHGEPLVTSYNRCFLGTVDYIWRSEGLRTVRVLAPIPKHAMQWTPGFPTKTNKQIIEKLLNKRMGNTALVYGKASDPLHWKWGSDHVALVSEFAFTNDSLTQNTESL